MSKRTHGLSEKEMELVRLLMADCRSTGDIQAKLKRLFAGTIVQMLETEMDEHLGYEKNSVLGNNTGNSRNGHGKKTIDRIFQISAGDSQNNIHDECCRSVPQNGAEVYEVQGNIPDGRFHPQGGLPERPGNIQEVDDVGKIKAANITAARTA